ncbi:UNKNOWN [Stylonychia lemnae]|uniref:Uncharacterized protein n=1 Tax=Stylonychia lemnae TaxID=5949 RepID=A0A078A6K0_STYLE|nr:UNKNOWN [Stylonychia lemnae]|eukprot:CDW77222.1 UNKNOWN [Stylonychia lemnae]
MMSQFEQTKKQSTEGVIGGTGYEKVGLSSSLPSGNPPGGYNVEVSLGPQGSLDLDQKKKEFFSSRTQEYRAPYQAGEHRSTFHAENQPILRQAPEVIIPKESKMTQAEGAIGSALHSAKESILHGYNAMKDTILGETAAHQKQDQTLLKGQGINQAPNANFSIHRDD